MVGGALVTPQPGSVYGGWITANLAGHPRVAPALWAGDGVSDDDTRPPDRSIPRGRLSRPGHFGRLAGGVGGMAAEGVRRLAAGERPRLGELLLTPGNAKRIADRLSHLRGAALKLFVQRKISGTALLGARLRARST